MKYGIRAEVIGKILHPKYGYLVPSLFYPVVTALERQWIKKLYMKQKHSAYR